MREQIAEELYYQNFRPDVRDKVISWETISDVTRQHFIEDADQILSLMREEIKKVENPFPEKRGFMAQFEAFEDCRQKIIKKLESE